MTGSPGRRINSRERRSSLGARQPKDDKRTAGRTTTTKTPTVIRGHGVDIDKGLSSYMRQRLGFKLGKFALRFTSVTVRFDTLDLREAANIQCLMSVQLPKVNPVIVTASAPGVRAAFDRTIDSCERALRRRLDRRRVRQRTQVRRRV